MSILSFKKKLLVANSHRTPFKNDSLFLWFNCLLAIAPTIHKDHLIPWFLRLDNASVNVKYSAGCFGTDFVFTNGSYGWHAGTLLTLEHWNISLLKCIQSYLFDFLNYDFIFWAQQGFIAFTMMFYFIVLVIMCFGP